MTLKEQLIQEIETMPDEILAEILDFAGFIKYKRTQQNLVPQLQTALPYRQASGRSILKCAGTWQGDDFEDCLQFDQGKGSGDYTAERHQWLDRMSMDDILADIRK